MVDPPGKGSDADASPLRIASLVEAAQDWIHWALWHAESSTNIAVRAFRSIAQLVVLTARGFQTDELLLRASALTYVTSLSVIPMLAVVIAILGLVGGDETLVNFAIDQLTTVAPEVRETVRAYATSLNLARFGTVGGAVVFGTTVLALRHLEGTLNDIWGVSQSRSWPRRFSDYLAVMVIAPILTGVAVSLGTTMQSEPAMAWFMRFPVFAQIHGVGIGQLPLITLFVAFTFLYWFFPNTHVRIGAAMLGGAVAAVLFSAARSIYVDFQVGAATYEAFFGALSAVPLILAWLYVCWAVVLLGAELAFATQNLSFARREMRSGEISAARREAIALEIATTIAADFRAQRTPPTAERLADVLDEPVRIIRRLLGELDQAVLIRAVSPPDRGDAGFVPAAPIEDLTVGHVLRAVRGATDLETIVSEQHSPGVAAAIGRINLAWTEIADRTSLESLVRESPHGPQRPLQPESDPVASSDP